MDKYRKTHKIEVIKILSHGYLVQNEGQPDDRWVIPTETFKATYEKVNEND